MPELQPDSHRATGPELPQTANKSIYVGNHHDGAPCLRDHPRLNIKEASCSRQLTQSGAASASVSRVQLYRHPLPQKDILASFCIERKAPASQQGSFSLLATTYGRARP